MRIMYEILNLLYTQEAKSKLIALTKKQIQQILAENGDVYVDRTIWNKLKAMSDNGLVCEGMKMGGSKTYYISTNGIQFLKDMERNVDEEGSKDGK